MTTSQKLIAGLADRTRVIDEELRTLTAEKRQADADRAALVEKAEAAWQELAAHVVPSLAADDLNAAAARLHLPALSAAQVHARLQQDRVERRNTLARIEADVAWQRRDELRNESAIRIDELNGNIVPLQESVAQLEGEPLFVELVRAGYDTDAYAVPFWRLTYFQHWKHGDLVVEKHGARLRCETFGAIRARYLEEVKALAPLKDARGRWQSRRESVERLDNAWRGATAALGSLEERHLQQARKRVIEHLRSLEHKDVEPLLSGAPGMLLAARRAFGLQAQERYLAALGAEMLDKGIQALREQRAKNERAMTKLRRPKYSHTTFSPDAFQRRLGKDRRDAFQKRRQRYAEARDRIVEFHDYQRFDPVRDVVWWTVMTDHARPEPWLPEDLSLLRPDMEQRAQGQASARLRHDDSPAHSAFNTFDAS